MKADSFSYDTFLKPCSDREDRIHSLLSRTLSSRDETSLLAHIETCPGCREYFEFMNSVDNGFRTSFSKHSPPPPDAFPQKLQEEMGRAMTKNLSAWLMEMGKALLLGQGEEADRIDYRIAPLTLVECRNHIENISGALSKPAESVKHDLNPEVLAECGLLCKTNNIKTDNSKYQSLTKECFDRSISIRPANWEAHNLLGIFYTTNNDQDSCISEQKKIITRNPGTYMEYSSHLSIASAFFLTGMGYEAKESLFHARSIRDDGIVNFSLFLLHFYLFDDLLNAAKYVNRMDRWFEREKEFSDQTRPLYVVTRYINRNFISLKSKASSSEHIFNIFLKYKDTINVSY